MKIALLGYGKMGKAIEEIAVSRGHQIVLRVTSKNAGKITNNDLSPVDVAIDFSRPDTVLENIYSCFDASVPVVVGTTGWYDQFEEVSEKCAAGQNAMVYASNFSPGVNIMFELNRVLARMMNRQPEYNISIEEIHHTEKLDAPSGTALTLANDIKSNLNRISSLVFTGAGKPDEKIKESSRLKVHSIRESEVTGTHLVTYISDIDKIEIRHEAFNRNGFAFGAVLAAEWIKGRQGCYTMKDVLEIDN